MLDIKIHRNLQENYSQAMQTHDMQNVFDAIQMDCIIWFYISDSLIYFGLTTVNVIQYL